MTLRYSKTLPKEKNILPKGHLDTQKHSPKKTKRKDIKEYHRENILQHCVSLQTTFFSPHTIPQ